MASTLNVTVALNGDHYLITGSLVEGGTLPQAIFVYENTGNASLGDFYGTCNIQELGRLTEYVGEAIPLLGNRYVRYGQIKIRVSLADDPTVVVNELVNNVKLLSKSYSIQTSTSSSYQIP